MSKAMPLLVKGSILAAPFVLYLLLIASAYAAAAHSPGRNEARITRSSVVDLTPGRDYVEIRGGLPYSSGDGKIEVVEVFGYVCPACARFHPLVGRWASKLPPDVRFQYLPAPWGRDWDPYARGFYVAESLKLIPRTHEALIKAIHIDNTMPSEGESPNDATVAKFYSRYGINEQAFLTQMHSFDTDTKMRRGKAFIQSSGVDGTPTLIVAGKYRVVGKTYQDKLRIAGRLIDLERVARVDATRR